MNWNYKVMAILVGVGVTLGGCHVFKDQTKHATATVKKEVVVPAVSLESLDARVTDIEKRMAAARAAKAKAAVRPRIVVQ